MIGNTTPTWLIIEYPDGGLEDKGFVDMSIRMPVMELEKPADAQETRHMLRAECPETGWKGGVAMDAGDWDQNTVRSPLTVVMPDGTKQKWHIGRGAYEFVRTHAFLWPIEQIVADPVSTKL